MDESVLGLLDFSASSILAGIFFGLIGYFIYKHGRKSADLRFVGIGLALMIYPYFTNGPLVDWGLGALLCGAAYYFKAH